MKVFGSRYQRTTPSEVFKRQCWINLDPDDQSKIIGENAAVLYGVA